MYQCAYCKAIIADEDAIPSDDYGWTCPSCWRDDALAQCREFIPCTVPDRAEHYSDLPLFVTREDGKNCVISLDASQEISYTSFSENKIVLGKDWMEAVPELRSFIFHHEVGHFMLHHNEAVMLYPEEEHQADAYAVACGCNPKPFISWLRNFPVKWEWNQKNHTKRIKLLEELI